MYERCRPVTLHTTMRLDSPALETSVGHAPCTETSVEQRTMAADGTLDVTLRARGSELDAFENGLEADETVSRWIHVGGSETARLYRIRLTERASATMDIDGWVNGRAVFPRVERQERRWVVDAFVPEREVIRQFERNCRANDVRFDLVRVSEADDVDETGEFGLTQLQTQTLLEAFDRGYYTVPRETNLQQVAQPLDVSHQALSERLRRGVGSLIENTIVTQWVGENGPGPSGPDSSTDVLSRDPSLDPSPVSTL